MSRKNPDEEHASEIVSDLIARFGRRGARQLFAPGKAGRPPGSGAIDDAAALRNMADLVHRSESSERKAAAASAHLTTGNSVPSTIDRLRRKFRKNRKSLLQGAERRIAQPATESPTPSELLNEYTRQYIAQYTGEVDRELEKVQAYIESLDPIPDAEALELLRIEMLGGENSRALGLLTEAMRRRLGLPSKG